MGRNGINQMRKNTTDRLRTITVTEGNVRNNHLYLTDLADFFPSEACGRVAGNDGNGRKVTLHVDGLSEPIETGITLRCNGNGTRRPRFFRRRAWVRRFFARHRISQGDQVVVERLGRFDYRVYPFRENGSNGTDKQGHQETLFPIPDVAAKGSANGDRNKVRPEDTSVHDWYRFVLSYPPHLVRDYVDLFGLTDTQRVLDPFCGTGTTIVECKKLGIPSVGIEAHPMSHFAASTKVTWAVKPRDLIAHAEDVAAQAENTLAHDGIRDEPGALLGPAELECLRTLPPEQLPLLLKGSISPLPLHKTLVLLDTIREVSPSELIGHMLLALAKSVVSVSSNLHFGPEVGVRKAKRDAPVIGPWLDGVRGMAEDLRQIRSGRRTEANVYHADARSAFEEMPENSVDAVITSPPYPNEKDYTRTMRLETVLLGFARNKAELRAVKKGLLRSNTRGVYKVDQDDQWVADNPRIDRIAKRIEARRIELGKTSGFERLYARVTRLYFGGMARHFASMRRVLRPGAKLAYVVGDQASYLRVLIRTGQLLAEIAESFGYHVERIDLFRTRLATATKKQLREEVVILRWPG